MARNAALKILLKYETEQSYLNITLNEYLYSASPYCIKYVVLHELTHFLYTNHDKQFFDFISIHMPDWQERKNKLNTDFNV